MRKVGGLFISKLGFDASQKTENLERLKMTVVEDKKTCNKSIPSHYRDNKFLGIFFILFLLIAIPLVFAEDEALVEKAYTCLEGKVSGKCASLTLDEQLFSLLALAYNSGIQSSCRSAIMANSKDNECWPKASCKLEETALAVIALNYIGADASKPEAWLLKQNKTSSDLNWYLEIDAREATRCTIKYDTSNSTASTIVMAGDKKLSLSGSGSCFSLANGNYWLQISNSCLGKTFRVSCDKDFFTALLYKKQSSDVWYVSSNTQSASASGTAETKVVSLCFKQGSDCNYEGSLWAALSLQRNNEINSYLPYLIANAQDNAKYNPYSFLQKISPSDEFLANIRNLQNPAGFWDLNSGYGKYHDTSLSIIGLREISDDLQVLTSKDWLQSMQANDGCWQTIKDTAFILYSAWPKEPVSGGVGITDDYCEDYGKFCASNTECNEAGGEILGNYECRSDSLKICCSKQPNELTCADKGGIKCSSSEDCSGDGSLVSSSDSSRCCIGGTCEERVELGCESGTSFQCKSTCASDEEIKTGSEFDCQGDYLCCGLKTPQGRSYWWIWLLIILIVLVVLAIIFRNRLKMYFFKFKNRGKSSKVQQTRPPFPPQGMMRPGMRPGMSPGMSSRPMPRPGVPSQKGSKTDRELDETLKKLKEMSK
ncbi:MAG: hypothetical protein ABH840_03740 [Nanoarchaeota archaeon]